MSLYTYNTIWVTGYNNNNNSNDNNTVTDNNMKLTWNQQRLSIIILFAGVHLNNNNIIQITSTMQAVKKETCKMFTYKSQNLYKNWYGSEQQYDYLMMLWTRMKLQYLGL